jgi:hypothetical protein
MRIIIAISQLDVDPELVRRRGAHGILGIVEHRRRRHTPLMAGEQ